MHLQVGTRRHIFYGLFHVLASGLIVFFLVYRCHVLKYRILLWDITNVETVYGLSLSIVAYILMKAFFGLSDSNQTQIGL